jgi:hypothetical protein
VEQGIVENDIDELQGSITEELYTALQVRFLEHDKLRQKETCRKADEKRNHISCYIAIHGYRTNGYLFLVKKVVVAKEVNKQAQHCYATTTGNIPEGLDRDPLFADRMKEIDDLQNSIFYKIELAAVSIVFHRWAKVMKMAYFWTVQLQLTRG